MTVSLLGDAFSHHVWATEQLIDHCVALTPEQLATTVPGTCGSIIRTIHHLVASDRWYLSFFREEMPQVDKTEVDLAALRSTIMTSGKAWAELLTGELDPDTVIEERDEEGVVYSPVGVRLAQVIHHGTDHRSQICTALSNLGVTPLEIDLWAYARATGRERTEPAPAP